MLPLEAAVARRRPERLDFHLLRQAAYMGALIWAFAAGTGETIVAPAYEVLKRRGVKFEFFHKVDQLRLSHDRRSVDAVEFTAATAEPVSWQAGAIPNR